MAVNDLADIVRSFQFAIKLLYPIYGTGELDDEKLDTAPYFTECYVFTEFLASLTGFGQPYPGDDLIAGAEQVETFCEQLLAAYPDGERWLGGAAAAYVDRIAALRDAAQDLADYDRKFASLVDAQADAVVNTRLGFGLLKAIIVIGTGIYRRIICYTDETTASWFQLKTCGAVAVVAGGLFSYLGKRALGHGATAKHWCHEYRNITGEKNRRGRGGQC